MSVRGPSELDISPPETLVRHRAGEIQLVDVREPYEFEAGHVAGARHLPLQELGARADSLDPGRPVVFYCRIGARSAVAAAAFRDAGYDAWNMAGGLEAWADDALPLEPQNGIVAAH